MSFFGDFLVQKKLISEKQLIESLCEQIKSTPPVVECLYKLEILSLAEISNVIKTQMGTDKSIFHILKSDFNLDVDSINKIKSYQMGMRKPLGQILVQSNILDQGTLQTELGHFLELKSTRGIEEFATEEALGRPSESPPEISAAALESLRELGITSLDDREESIAPAIESSGASVEVSQAALESLKELGISEDAVYEDFQTAEMDPFVEEFLAQVSEGKIQKLFKILSMVKSSYENKTDYKNILNSLYREVHIIKGAVRLSDLKLTEKLLTSAEGLVEIVLSKSNKAVDELFLEYYNVLEEWVNVLSDLSDQLKIKNEIEIMSDQEFKSRFIELIKKIGLVAKKLRSIN